MLYATFSFLPPLPLLQNCNKFNGEMIDKVVNTKTSDKAHVKNFLNVFCKMKS